MHGREWLALAPFGFKCAVGAAEHVFSRAEAEAEAAADKAAEEAAAEAASGAAAGAKTATKKTTTKKRPRGEAEAGEEGAKAAEAPSGLPKAGSLRLHLLTALCAGLSDRSAIVGWVGQRASGRFGEGSASRGDAVTTLGKEKSMRVPLWRQEGALYALTAAGREAARRGGIPLGGQRKRQKKGE